MTDRPARKPRRKRFTYRELFRIVARQVEYWPVDETRRHDEIGIACSICGEPIRDGEEVDLDHSDAVGFGEGRDVPENCAFLHSHCHKAKTAKDKARMAKADRAGGWRGSQVNRRKQHGPTMESRGFDKRFRKRMDGTVEKRDV